MKIETTWGSIEIKLLDGKVAGCTLPFLPTQPNPPFAITDAENDPVSRFVTAVLSGKNAKVPALRKTQGTEFQQYVWMEISKISAGETRTYGELAEAIGRPKAVRAVGSACGHNPVPLFIPCHRVKGAHGGLGGFSAGLPWKMLLLTLET